jgi:transporter family-2 protein
MYWAAVFGALISGYLLSIQGVSNALGSKLMGTPALVATMSLVQALPPLILVLMKSPAIGWGAALSHGWKWFVISGVIGIIVVSSLSFSITNLGALTVFVLVILGQIVGAAIADQIGLFGTPVKPMNTMKIISILVIALGVFLLIKSEPKPKNQASLEMTHPFSQRN